MFNYVRILEYEFVINKVYINVLSLIGTGGSLMDFTSYMHERADESRHNASLSFSTAILGTVLLVGGVLVTVVTTTSPQWILFFPYQLTSDPRGLLGMTLTVVGLALLILGIGLAIHYASQRLWYLRELKNVYAIEESKLKSKRKSRFRRKKKPQ